MGIVGAGFVGPHHIDAVRRLGYVDIVGVAGSSQASADRKAEALGARRAYGSYEALLDDPDIQVIHNATPIAAGKKATDAHPPAFATFEDGYRANVIVEAILESAAQGSVWTKVNY